MSKERKQTIGSSAANAPSAENAASPGRRTLTSGMRPRLRASRPVLTFTASSATQTVKIGSPAEPPGAATAVPQPGPTAPVVVEEVQHHAEGPHQRDFSISPGGIQGLLPGGEVELAVVFTPREPGMRTAALIAERVAAPGEAARVTLIGQAPAATRSPAAAAPPGTTTGSPAAPGGAAERPAAEAPSVIEVRARNLTAQAASDQIARMQLILPKGDYLGARTTTWTTRPAPWGTVTTDQDGNLEPIGDLSVGSIIAGPPGGRIGDGTAHSAYASAIEELGALRVHNQALRQATGGVITSRGRLSERERRAVASATAPNTDTASDLVQSRIDVESADAGARQAYTELAAAEKTLAAAQHALVAMERDVKAWDLEKRRRKTGQQLEALRKARDGARSRIAALLSYTGKMLKFASKITSRPLEALGEGVEGLAALYGKGDVDEVGRMKAELGKLEAELALAQDESLQARVGAAQETLSAALFGVDAKLEALTAATQRRSGEYELLGKRLGTAVAPRLGRSNTVGDRVATIPALEALRSVAARIDTRRMRSFDDPAQVSNPADAAYARWLHGNLPGIADAVDALRAFADDELDRGRALTDSLGIDR